jgi:hypothetical protein
MQASSVLRRVVAAGIDCVVALTLGFVGVLFVQNGGITLEELSRNISSSVTPGGPDVTIDRFWIALLGVNLVYYLSEAVTGVTLGKLLSGISIRAVNGERASLKALGFRYCLKHSPGLLGVAGIITAWSLLNDVQPWVNVVVILAFMIATITKHHMAGYDMVAGTNVFCSRAGCDFCDKTSRPDITEKLR